MQSLCSKTLIPEKEFSMTPFKERKKFSYLLMILLFLLVSVHTVSADEGHDPFEKKASSYIINLAAEETFKVGSNEIAIRLRSEHGDAVALAGVQVEVLPVDDHSEPKESQGDSKLKEPSHRETKIEQKSNGHDDENGTADESDEHGKGQAVIFVAGHKPGIYHGEIDFPNSGSWRIVVHFDIDHKEDKVEYLAEVAPGNSKAGVLFGFLSVNLVAILGAGFQKRKTSAAKKAVVGVVKEGVERNITNE
jgi:hypothetical protein